MLKRQLIKIFFFFGTFITMFAAIPPKFRRRILNFIASTVFISLFAAFFSLMNRVTALGAGLTAGQITLSSLAQYETKYYAIHKEYATTPYLASSLDSVINYVGPETLSNSPSIVSIGGTLKSLSMAVNASSQCLFLRISNGEPISKASTQIGHASACGAKIAYTITGQTWIPKS
jgi:hypothetical protein